MFYNRILADKKPYFFKYKYKALNKELNEYIKKNDENAQIHFSKSLNQLLSTEQNDSNQLTQEEKVFLSYYHRFLPVIDSNCVMNRICKYIESIDFEIKKRVRTTSDFDYKVLMSDSKVDVNYCREVLLPILEQHFNEWVQQAKARKMTRIEKSLGIAANKAAFEKEAQYSKLKDELLLECPNEEKLANYLVHIFYKEKTSLNKSALWILVGKQIYENVKQKHDSFKFPIKNPQGNIEFLYEKYILEQVQIPKKEEVVEDAGFENISINSEAQIEGESND